MRRCTKIDKYEVCALEDETLEQLSEQHATASNRKSMAAPRISLCSFVGMVRCQFSVAGSLYGWWLSHIDMYF